MPTKKKLLNERQADALDRYRRAMQAMMRTLDVFTAFTEDTEDGDSPQELMNERLARGVAAVGQHLAAADELCYRADAALLADNQAKRLAGD